MHDRGQGRCAHRRGGAGTAGGDAGFHAHRGGLVRADDAGASADADGADKGRRAHREMDSWKTGRLEEGAMVRLNVRHDAAFETPTPSAAPLVDLRFSVLLGAEAWARLPAPVRARFSKR